MGLSISQMALMSRLLDEALPLDATARRLWLERLSPEYSEITPALWEALLPEESQVAISNPLWPLPKLLAADAAGGESRSCLQAGARVGPYELIRPLGAGGMAEVWLARRADGALKRTVALKIPTLTRLSGELEQRFARERDILASLEHPHIARLYDAGIAADSNKLPYFAMEYVEGQPLTDWCDARRLPIAARLELCLQVLDAMQYAHDKHVVHRDLKPSNILVTESGRARLLDFGVAKLLEEEADQTQLTSVYGRALTPNYASPELLRGERLDARCDIYSFGVVLYELLAGVRPYQLQSAASLGLLEQAIARVEVKKPSTQLEPEAAARRATTQEGLARLLRGDLDAVVVKTLAKEPADRYPSATDLAKDLRRYLEGRPIEALPARFPYRLGKFVRRNKPLFAVSVTAVAAIVLALGYTLYRESSLRARGASEVTVSANPEGAATTVTVALPAAFSPPAHSVAVLPFVNLSGDKEQEYFSDGLTEELLNSLAQINDLQVAARTSSFSFKGEKVDLGTIARKLNVGAILEGSVRRSGETIRVTAQLNNSVTGFHLWSQTYDRKLNDVLKLQTEIATAVASALQVTLLGDVAARVELGGTRNPAAFEAYLRGEKAYGAVHDSPKDLPVATAAYTEAIRLDPHYALAFAARSLAFSVLAVETPLAASREALAKAQADARQALALAPDLARAHLASALAALTNLDLTQASEALKRALTLAPGNAEVLRNSGVVAAQQGQFDAGLAAVRRAVVLDPLNRESHYYLGWALYAAHRYEEAGSAYAEVISLEPDFEENYGFRGLAYYGLGDLQSARASCETKPDFWASHWCLAVTYHKLGRHSDAETELSKLKAATGDASAFQYATIYAQWGDQAKALEWLETAFRLRDAGMATLKTFPLLDPLRKEPRFQAIERELKFPSARSTS